MLNFVLCDDNLNIIKKLKEMLEIIFLKNNIDAAITLVTDDPNKVLEFEQKNDVDVLILDINLNDKMSGLDLAKQIRKNNKNVYIIFSTGHLEYSLIAYTVKTFDYLPKPITLERLEITVNRLLDDIDSKSQHQFVKLNNKTIINEKEINYIRRDGMKLVFCTKAGEFEAYSSFTKLAPTLPNNFVRCHKSYIVNTENITNINSNHSKIIFDDNSYCDIGPKYKNNLMEVFNYGILTNNLDSINNGE